MNRTERGASAVEYALLLAGISALLVLAIFSLGPVVGAMYDTCDDIAARDASTSTCG